VAEHYLPQLEAQGWRRCKQVGLGQWEKYIDKAGSVEANASKFHAILLKDGAIAELLIDQAEPSGRTAGSELLMKQIVTLRISSMNDRSDRCPDKITNNPG
jgi:hypothetical protein